MPKRYLIIAGLETSGPSKKFNNPQAKWARQLWRKLRYAVITNRSPRAHAEFSGSLGVF
jgi:hypothetical protein